MIDMNVVTLEDNKEYMIIGAEEVDNKKYLILTNEEEPEKIVVRRIITENNEDFLVKLDTKDEYDKVIYNYYEEYKRRNENEK